MSVPGVLWKYGAVLLTFAIVVVAIDYMSSVLLRSNAHDCERKQSDNGVYIAELCLLRDNGHDADYLGRVYATQSGALIAERTFDAMETGIYWDEASVAFQRGGKGDSLIRVPPTLVDRLRTRLP